MPLSAQPDTGRLDISASAGAYRAAEFQIADASGSAVTGWTGADAPDIEVWSGDDREALTGTGLSASWASDTDGTVTIEADGTHTLSPATYLWRMLATFGGNTYEVCRGNYVVNAAPGTTDETPDEAVSPYTTIDDIRTLCAGIEQVQGKHDRTGFAEHQEAARAWFDDIILSAYRSSNSLSSVRSTPYGYAHVLSDVDYPPQWLRDVLATGTGVKITPRIKRACAAYACYSIMAAQMTLDETASVYRKKAVQFRSMAHNEVISMTVWIKSSTTATDWTIPINLGVATRN